MKKIFIIVTIILIVTNVNAQWFLGGEIGISAYNINETVVFVDRNEPNTISKTHVGFMLAPKGGYYFNEKFALGLSFYIGSTFAIDALYKDQKYREYSINWGVYPFVRFSVFTYKKVSLVLEVSTGVGSTQTFWKLGDSKTEKGSTTIAIGVFNMTPILSFNLTDHLQMEAGLNFLNIGYNIDIISREKGPPPYVYYKTSTTKHDFNIGFNSSSIFVLTQLRFGIVYKF